LDRAPRETARAPLTERKQMRGDATLPVMAVVIGHLAVIGSELACK
jgi:hypothetical protein